MRMRNLIFTDGKKKRRPWVSELITSKRAPPVSPDFHRGSDFFAMGGYAFCLAGGGDDRMPLALLALHTVLQRRGHSGAAWRSSGARGADACRNRRATGGGVNLRRKTGYGWFARCWRAWADHCLKPRPRCANIDLFYTPAKSSYGKRETQQPPAAGQRLRVGGW